MQQLINFLNRPYPEEKDYKSYLMGLIGISVFITLFLFAFKPFNLHMVRGATFLLCLGFGAITFIVSIVYDFLIRILFKVNKFGKQYTLGKWIIITMGLILVIGISNFLFISYYLGFSINGLGYMIISTFLVGIFPLVFFGSFAVRQGEKKYSEIADDIKIKEATHSLESVQLFGVNSDNIRYIEAMQNYIRIWHSTDNELAQKTERATLSTIESDIGSSSLKRCHRSYIVNTSSITDVKGNAQGLQLTLKDVAETISVSRKYVDDFR